MGKREDYEHLERDNDGYYYYFMNSNVDTPWKEPQLKDFLDWWRKNEVNTGLYYKGTKLYFTFKDHKYYVSWTFYDEDYINQGIKFLRRLGAENIQINYGELD